MHEVLFAQGVAKHELGPETSLEISSTFEWHLSHLYNDAHQKLEQRMAIVGCITEEASRALDLSLCKDDRFNASFYVPQHLSLRASQRRSKAPFVARLLSRNSVLAPSRLSVFTKT